MAGPLERHRLKDDETLRVPPPVKQSPQLPHQDAEITPPHLPVQRFVALRWHYCEVTPPPLPLPIFRYPAV